MSMTKSRHSHDMAALNAKMAAVKAARRNPQARLSDFPKDTLFRFICQGCNRCGQYKWATLERMVGADELMPTVLEGVSQDCIERMIGGWCVVSYYTGVEMVGPVSRGED